jgi:hypothetical protein
MDVDLATVGGLPFQPLVQTDTSFVAIESTSINQFIRRNKQERKG